MNIKKGDNVIMNTGKDHGKTGKITAVFQDGNKVVVEGLNTIKRHQRARREGQKGQILIKERAIDASNVQIVCPRCGKPTRVGHKIDLSQGKAGAKSKTRICRKCGGDL